MKRKPIPQEIRQQVYEMYDGHCAYVGCELLRRCAPLEIVYEPKDELAKGNENAVEE